MILPHCVKYTNMKYFDYEYTSIHYYGNQVCGFLEEFLTFLTLYTPGIPLDLSFFFVIRS